MMGKYVLKRALYGLILLLSISFLAFGTIYLAEGDPVEMYYIARSKPLPDEEILEQKREEKGVNDPFILQYGRWMKNFLQGDMGISFKDDRPVVEKLKEAFPETVKLALPAFILTFSLCVPLGLYSAKNKGSIIDKVISGTSFVMASIPEFVSGVFLLIIFAVKLKILPVLSAGTPNGLILPIITLSLTMVGKYTRQIRARVIEELQSSYVVCLKQRGFKDSVILYGNVLKNCAPLIITLMATALGYLMAGTAIVESLFGLSGLGHLIMDSVLFRDYPTVQAFVLMSGSIYLIVNLVADILYKVIDHRVEIG